MSKVGRKGWFDTASEKDKQKVIKVVKDYPSFGYARLITMVKAKYGITVPRHTMSTIIAKQMR